MLSNRGYSGVIALLFHDRLFST